MNIKVKIIVFLILCMTLSIISSCDPSGNIYIINGYPHAVLLHSVYNYNGETYIDSRSIPAYASIAPAARRVAYNHLVSMRIEDVNDQLLVEYPIEYVLKIRNVFLAKKGSLEFWIFTEKGLFLETQAIRKRFKNDNNRIIEYYQSNVAVQDLEAILVKNENP